MTPETFVAGEGSTIAPAPGEYYRFMHRPPNSGNNAFFLEALRLTLVNETTDANDVPRGLELAFATPRAWLRSGRIAVNRAPTSFGPLSYSIDACATFGARERRPAEGASAALCGGGLRLRLPASASA